MCSVEFVPVNEQQAGVPRSLVAVCSECMRKDPINRPTAVAILERADVRAKAGQVGVDLDSIPISKLI